MVNHSRPQIQLPISRELFTVTVLKGPQHPVSGSSERNWKEPFQEDEVYRGQLAWPQELECLHPFPSLCSVQRVGAFKWPGWVYLHPRIWLSTKQGSFLFLRDLLVKPSPAQLALSLEDTNVPTKQMEVKLCPIKAGKCCGQFLSYRWTVSSSSVQPLTGRKSWGFEGQWTLNIACWVANQFRDRNTG